MKPSGSAGMKATILVVEDDEVMREVLSVHLRAADYEVTLAADGEAARDSIRESAPDLIVSDVNMPRIDGLTFLKGLRENESTERIPLILLTSRGETGQIVEGFDLGADDYLVKPVNGPELLARVRAKIERPPVPADSLPRDRQTNLLSERGLLREIERETARTRRGGDGGVLAVLSFDETAGIRERLGGRTAAGLAKHVAEILQRSMGRLDLAARDREGRFLLLLVETTASRAHERLAAIAQEIASRQFAAAGEKLRVTPLVGYAAYGANDSVAVLKERAMYANAVSASRLDIHPVLYTPDMEEARRRKDAEAKVGDRRARIASLRLPAQIALSFVLGLGLPFSLYVLLGNIGWDITRPVYDVVVVALCVTALLIWTEGFMALRRVDPPEEPATPYPRASAIIAAYLPNEAATILDTVDAFLRIDYPEPLQIIVAYNTPRRMPVEERFKEIAARNPRFLPLRVEGSTSKAQNVNAALGRVSGDFVGIFDADHHPDAGSYRRAWRWLSRDCDVVQGHCLVRNGDASWVARLIAVEFENIYSISHPGRARAHGYGIFGGSNGYWRTALLRATRMRHFMLTEDIDSSLRIIEQGARIVSDPYLISRELAPTTLKSLWGQRMRWAQGWFQVSMKHTWACLRSKHLSPRQKWGLFHLLLWRECFPWLSFQILPILLYWMWWRAEPLNWLIPLFVFTSALTLSTGPGQVLLTYMKSDPEIRSHKKWFVFYLVASILFYTEYKNLIARLSQFKEMMREQEWKVTARD
jgi:cellulose synthase/poly-beta-1,6-N-acetylglucosamine synthase-like glycosyltransferase/CheY-like chemotaxis protein